MLKWNDSEFLRDDIVNDANLLEQCFTVIRQLLICNRDEVLRQNPKLEELTKGILNQITDKLA